MSKILITATIFLRHPVVMIMKSYSRALIFHPEVHTDEGTGADDIGTGIVGGAVPLKIASHGGLSPLCPIELRR